MVPVQYFPCLALNIKKGNIASFSRIMIGKINIMDTNWYRNPSMSEIIGRCDGDEKNNDHAERTKVER